jgi:hypothetical protein
VTGLISRATDIGGFGVIARELEPCSFGSRARRSLQPSFCGLPWAHLCRRFSRTAALSFDGSVVHHRWRKRRHLCLCSERDQHIASDGRVRGCEAEEVGECGVPIAAAVEAVDKLVEIGLQMLAAQTVIDA